MFLFFAGLLIGFIAGALVYRNNAKKAEALIADAQAAAAKAKAELEALKK